jgi:hypothetical protein
LHETELLLQHAARASLSRRRFLRSGVAAAGALAGVGLLNAGPAFGADGAEPRPIPGGFDASGNPVGTGAALHVQPPGVGFEMSTITDFNGVIAAADVQGTANNGAYFFDCDMRFMDGLYVGTDGKLRQGSFGFV